MAPLAGLEDRPLAPIMSRVGRLLFERGEEIYNFQRRAPVTRTSTTRSGSPRYIAAPHKWAIPMLLADVGLSQSGGMAGIGLRSKKPKEKSNGVPAPAAAA